jgi:hypothetical protein
VWPCHLKHTLQLIMPHMSTSISHMLGQPYLQPLEDPFALVQAQWADELSAASAAGVPPVFTVPDPPLQPVYYHIEVSGCDGPQQQPLSPRSATKVSVCGSVIATGGAPPARTASNTVPQSEASFAMQGHATASATGSPVSTPLYTVGSHALPDVSEQASKLMQASSFLAGAEQEPSHDPGAGMATQYASIPMRVDPPQPPMAGEPGTVLHLTKAQASQGLGQPCYYWALHA